MKTMFAEQALALPKSEEKKLQEKLDVVELLVC